MHAARFAPQGPATWIKWDLARQQSGLQALHMQWGKRLRIRLPRQCRPIRSLLQAPHVDAKAIARGLIRHGLETIASDECRG